MFVHSSTVNCLATYRFPQPNSSCGEQVSCRKTRTNCAAAFIIMLWSRMDLPGCLHDGGDEAGDATRGQAAAGRRMFVAQL